jgi:hypothetical protein
MNDVLEAVDAFANDDVACCQPCCARSAAALPEVEPCDGGAEMVDKKALCIAGIGCEYGDGNGGAPPEVTANELLLLIVDESDVPAARSGSLAETLELLPTLLLLLLLLLVAVAVAEPDAWSMRRSESSNLPATFRPATPPAVRDELNAAANVPGPPVAPLPIALAALPTPLVPLALPATAPLDEPNDDEDDDEPDEPDEPMDASRNEAANSDGAEAVAGENIDIDIDSECE